MRNIEHRPGPERQARHWLMRASATVVTGVVLSFVLELLYKTFERWPLAGRRPRPVATAAVPAAMAPAGAPGPVVAGYGGGLAAFRHAPFVVYYAGLAFGLNAFFIYYTAQGWLALQLTDSPAAISLLFTVSSFPMLALMLFGGVLADRLDRRWLILGSRFVQAGIVGGMALMTLTGRMSVPAFVVFALLHGTISALNLPARQAFLADLLPPRALGNGYAWQAALDFMASTAGPVVAGYTIAVSGIGAALVLSTAGHLLMCIAMLFVRSTQRRIVSTEGVGRRIAGGLGYVRRSPAILQIMLLATIPSLTAWGTMPLLPIVARDILHGDAGTYGWLNGAIGIGSVLGAVFIALAHRVRLKGLLAIGGAAASGLALVALAYTGRIEVALAFLLVFGAFTGVEATLTQSLVQVLSPPEFHGRVASVYMLTWNFQPIGIILFGGIAQTQGVPFAIWSAGLSMAAMALALAAVSGSLRRLRV